MHPFPPQSSRRAGALRALATAAIAVAMTVGPPSSPAAADDVGSADDAARDRAATDAAPRFSPCTIGDGRSRAAADCATLDVPLDPALPDGATLALSLARVPARRGGEREPFTLIAGGPGQSAIDTWPGVAFAFRHIASERDVILVDQRGTGGSHRLDCPADEGGAALVAPDAEPDSSPEEIARRAAACRDALDADPTLFTTSVAVADLERVREALGIERWNLYGVSYGTRVAQHYARRHPERVRTLILDAVVPPDMPLGPDIAAHAERALALGFERCAATPACATRFPDIAARTRRWLGSLRASPLEVSHEDLASGERRTTRLGDQELATVLRLLSYSAQTVALLPSMLDAAMARGNLAPLVRQAELQRQLLGDSLAGGMHQAIVCTEDVPRFAASVAAEADPERPESPGGLGLDIVPALLAGCRDWPVGRLDADFAEPLRGDVPTLLLSGEADPVTPPAWAEHVAAGLSRARHLVNPGQGHMQAPLGCTPALMARFVATAEPDALDTDCLDRLVPPPFFVDANGPLP